MLCNNMTEVIMIDLSKWKKCVNYTMRKQEEDGLFISNKIIIHNTLPILGAN